LVRSKIIVHVLFVCAFTSSLFLLNLLTAHALFTQEPLAVRHFVTRESRPTTAETPRPVRDRPCMSIIVDDVGDDLPLLQRLGRLRYPVTVSVLPGARRTSESATWAFEHGMEVMAHIPMEPERRPDFSPVAAPPLLASMSDNQLYDSVLAMIGSIPHAAGANNHMGSRLTSDRRRMAVVVGALKKRLYYFIDSRTSPNSAAFETAQEARFPSAARDIFLDEGPPGPSLLSRLLELAETARRYGTAVAICHLRGETVAELLAVRPEYFPDVAFVPASSAVFVATDENAAMRRYSLQRRAANRPAL
jgi:polysaccharide deacetylase 2 family uncharacterized protein YibQ